MAEETSDLASDIENLTRRKRRKIMSSSDDDSEDQSILCEPPKLPKAKKVILNEGIYCLFVLCHFYYFVIFLVSNTCEERGSVHQSPSTTGNNIV